MLALAPGASLALAGAAAMSTPTGAQVSGPVPRDAGEISVTEFGARGDGKLDDHAAFTAAVAAAVNAGRDLIIPTGVYRLDRSLELGFAGLRVLGRGKAILRFTGQGPAVTIDAGEDRILYDNHLQNLLIAGDGRSAQDGLFVRNVVHGTRRDLRVTSVTGTAFHVAGDVLSTYDRCRVADNETARGDVVPAIDFLIEGSRLNAATTACLFINCMAERSRQTGWDIVRCDDSRWVGGTAEGVDGVGLRLGKQSRGNSFDSLFLEGNAQGDIVCAGKGNTFHQCNATSAAPTSPYERVPSILIAAGAEGTRLDGGRAFAVRIEPGAKNTRIANADITYRIDDRGVGTTVANTRQGYHSDDRFPAATLGNVDNADPLALDWYREAAFTPAFVAWPGRGSVGRSVAIGRGTRIGDVVFVTMTITIGGLAGPAAADLVIEGLPYPSAKRLASILPMQLSGHGTGMAQTEPGTHRLTLTMGTGAPVRTGDLTAGTILTIAGHYMV